MSDGPHTETLIAAAIEAGAARAGVMRVGGFEPELERLRRSKESGLAGPLHFTYDDPEVAADVRMSFPWARSILVMGHEYASKGPRQAASGAVVARFAAANHYEPLHDAARRVADALRSEGFRAEILIDDNRLLDRAAAIRAGIGWMGKSTMVLAPGQGPWMLIGSVVTDAVLERTDPMVRDCGTCVACLPACPTGAITADGLDARLCLSTWLQTPGSLPQWIRPHLGRRIYGCDDCLTSCPPGMRMIDRAAEALELPFADLLSLSDQELIDTFSWWYVPRRDGRFIRRNLLVAAGNSCEEEAVGQIATHLDHRSSMIRSHAAWALARSRGEASRSLLAAMFDRETAPETRDELMLTFLMLDHASIHQTVMAFDRWIRTKPGHRSLGVTGLGEGDGRPRFILLSRFEDEQPPPTDLGISYADTGDERLVGFLARAVIVTDPLRKMETIRREARVHQAAGTVP